MPRRLAHQRMTLSGLEWPVHASRAISAVAELLVLYIKFALYTTSFYVPVILAKKQQKCVSLAHRRNPIAIIFLQNFYVVYILYSTLPP